MSSAWMRSAACAEQPDPFLDPILDWTPDNPDTPVHPGAGRQPLEQALARRTAVMAACAAVCARCPVIPSCRDWAGRECLAGFAAGHPAAHWDTWRAISGVAAPRLDPIRVLGVADRAADLTGGHLAGFTGLTDRQIGERLGLSLRSVQRARATTRA